ncbi:MAG: hypothetical protein QM766_27570 [Burkholderiaceae bacterium]
MAIPSSVNSMHSDEALIGGRYDLASDPIVALGAGLLGGRGTFANRLGQGIDSAMQVNQQGQRLRMQQQLANAQLTKYQAEMAEAQRKRDAEAARMDVRRSVYGPTSTTGPVQAGTSGDGSASPGTAATGWKEFATNAVSSLSRTLRPGQDALLRLAEAGALESTDIALYNAFQPRTVQPGTYQEGPDGRREYVADPTKGYSFDGTKVGVLPGYTESNADIRGKEAEAVERAKADYGTPLSITPAGGGPPRMMTPRQASDYLTGRTSPPPPAATPPGRSPVQASPDTYGRMLNDEFLRAAQDLESGDPNRMLKGRSAMSAIEADAKARGIELRAQIPAGTSGGPPPSQPGAIPGVPVQSPATAEAAKTTAQLDAQSLSKWEGQIPALTSTLKRLERMREQAQSGSLYANAGAEAKLQFASLAQAIGIPIDVERAAQSEVYLANVAEMVKERLASGAYGAGTGVSNVDLLAANRPLPELTKTPQGRLMLIDALVADTQDALKGVQGARSYYDSNNSSLRGYRWPGEDRARPKSADGAQPGSLVDKARAAIASGAPRQAIVDRLEKQYGITNHGL